MTNYYDQATALSFQTNAYINGQFVPSISGLTFETHNPATGKLLADVASCEAADIDVAVKNARRVFEAGDWSKMSPAKRKKILLKFADLIEANTHDLALLETYNSGKPIFNCLTEDLPAAVESIRWHAEAIDKIYDLKAPTGNDVVAMIVREPMGVVGIVVPWNYPISTVAVKIGPSLAAGNSVVVKPAELTPLTSLRLAELGTEAGLPDGVLNIVPGLGHIAGAALGLHNDVDLINFTGSTAVGRMFLEYSAKSNLKGIVLECGGKSPSLVLDDINDFDFVAEQVTLGFLANQGELCSAGTRCIVHNSIREQLLEKIKEKCSAWILGDPFESVTRLGAMIDKNHMGKVLSFIDAGKSEGADLVLGGGQVRTDSGGSFVEATVFDNVKNEMTIAQSEIFGPVLAVVGFDNIDEGIKISNASKYGLAAYVYTDSLNNAHNVANSLRAGTVSVNSFSTGDMTAPFGGYKESGFGGGREKSLAAHEQYTETKTIWIQLR
jgi:gamma-glutamyl-gamma-aminobutyraldehyde dehydrogenase